MQARRAISAEYSERLVRHEAGHFLVGYAMGLPVDAYRADDPVRNAVQFVDPRPAGAWRGLEHEDVDRLCAVSLAGVVAEAMRFGDGVGGVADLGQLQGAHRAGGARPEGPARRLEAAAREAAGSDGCDRQDEKGLRERRPRVSATGVSAAGTGWPECQSGFPRSHGRLAVEGVAAPQRPPAARTSKSPLRPPSKFPPSFPLPVQRYSHSAAHSTPVPPPCDTTTTTTITTITTITTARCDTAAPVNMLAASVSDNGVEGVASQHRP